jgi:hypothetical protein
MYQISQPFFTIKDEHVRETIDDTTDETLIEPIFNEAFFF